jgi:hypothetical protein
MANGWKKVIWVYYFRYFVNLLTKTVEEIYLSYDFCWRRWPDCERTSMNIHPEPRYPFLSMPIRLKAMKIWENKS